MIDKGTPLPELLNKVVRDLEEQRRKEEARRAKLTPEQRRVEDETKSKRDQAQTAAKVRKRFDRATRDYRGHETLTLREFSYLLHGLNPAEYSVWGFMRSTEADSAISRLERARGVSLLPVNPGASAPQLLFKTVELIAWARGKGFGNVEILVRALGAESQAQVTVSEPPGVTSSPAVATAARSEDDANHRALVKVAVEELITRSRKLAGRHKVDASALPFQHADIYERYCENCEARDIDPLSKSSVRQLVSKGKYKLDSGNRAGWKLELLRMLRSK